MDPFPRLYDPLRPARPATAEYHAACLRPRNPLSLTQRLMLAALAVGLLLLLWGFETQIILLQQRVAELNEQVDQARSTLALCVDDLLDSDKRRVAPRARTP